jgi:hypothetical protein
MFSHLPQPFLPSCQLPEREVLRKNLKEKWQSMRELLGKREGGTRKETRVAEFNRMILHTDGREQMMKFVDNLPYGW